VEVVSVMAVVAVLSGLTVPAVRGLGSANSLSTGTRNLAGLLQSARMEAIARHTIVRVGILTASATEADARLRKVSTWAWDPEFRRYFQIAPWTELPVGVILEPTTPEYIRNAEYSLKDGASVRGDFVLDPAFAEKAEFTTDDREHTVRFIEFTPSGAARVSGGSLRNVILVATSGVVNSDGSLLRTSGPGNRAANWAQINVDKLTGRVRVYRP
jgi:hypothetical protein